MTLTDAEFDVAVAETRVPIELTPENATAPTTTLEAPAKLTVRVELALVVNVGPSCHISHSAELFVPPLLIFVKLWPLYEIDETLPFAKETPTRRRLAPVVLNELIVVVLPAKLLADAAVITFIFALA